jgi:hypothetical protein
MARKSTSIKIDDDLWHAFKMRALEKRMDISTLLEQLIRKELKK